MHNEEHKKENSKNVEYFLFEISVIQFHRVVHEKVTERFTVAFNQHQQQVSIKSVFSEEKRDLISK